MTKIVCALTLALSGASLALHSTGAQGNLRVASANVERRLPSTFSQLPQNIVRDLQARGCTVPQADFGPKPNNVIKGNFATRQRSDWAVLCSKGGNSSILVYWGSSVKSPAELARAPDEAYWLGNEREGFHYYRHIMTANKKYILLHYREYGRGEFIPPINHDGIDDGFLEKGSEVYYFYRHKWLSLPGAD